MVRWVASLISKDIFYFTVIPGLSNPPVLIQFFQVFPPVNINEHFPLLLIHVLTAYIMTSVANSHHFPWVAIMILGSGGILHFTTTKGRKFNSDYMAKSCKVSELKSSRVSVFGFWDGSAICVTVLLRIKTK
jgi:hypothetical protein